jgi:hypothetical protein
MQLKFIQQTALALLAVFALTATFCFSAPAANAGPEQPVAAVQPISIPAPSLDYIREIPGVRQRAPDSLAMTILSINLRTASSTPSPATFAKHCLSRNRPAPRAIPRE